MTCTVHEFRIDQSGTFVCRNCGLTVSSKKLPDRDPEKPIKPLKGQKSLPLRPDWKTDYPGWAATAPKPTKKAKGCDF